MNFCNCPNCQTDNCPNADRESGLVECVEALRDELHALEVWVKVESIPADVFDGMQISLSKIKTALKAANPNSDVKQAFPNGRFT
jgi:hypothetical protein